MCLQRTGRKRILYESMANLYIGINRAVCVQHAAGDHALLNDLFGYLFFM